MNHKFIQKRIDYTGAQLRSHWIYENFELPGSAIVVFRGAADVDKHLVDMVDSQKKEYIYSEDMLHFIVEHFSLDLERTIAYQRLLIAIMGEAINSYYLSAMGEEQGRRCQIKRYGDDLYDGGDKLTVSIATLTTVSTMIHAGINISSKGTPVPTKGLLDYGMSETDISAFAEAVCSSYTEEIKSIRMARCKVRGVR
ncbi:DUF366 family protein [Candidatus Desantisbacteria bacterium]|nr:DUF366 family protein [Candidatus Desantisbacteria bacterium]